MQVLVIGSGYVGLVAAACFAEAGHHILGVDLDVAKATRLIRLHADGQKLTRVTLLQGGDTIAVERANGEHG